MKKSILRVIALILMFSMFAPIVSAVAAEEPFVQPTIEEILNNYHEKAFAAQNDPSNNWFRRTFSILSV